MKKMILALTLIAGTTAQAGILSDLLDTRNPAEKCADMVIRHYGKNKDLILGCHEHESKYSNRCVELIIESNSQMHPKSTLICSYVKSKYGVKAMEEFSLEYKMTVANQLTLSHVDTEKEAQCVIDLIGAKDLNNNDLTKCMNDSKEAMNIRSGAVLGTGQTIANQLEEKFEQAMDWFNNLIN